MQLPPKIDIAHDETDLVLDWAGFSPELRRFILLHLVRAMDEYNIPSLEFSRGTLARAISRNTGGILVAQIEIFIENLIYHGFILETPENRLKLTDKVFEELKNLDRIINFKECGR